MQLPGPRTHQSLDLDRGARPCVDEAVDEAEAVVLVVGRLDLEGEALGGLVVKLVDRLSSAGGHLHSRGLDVHLRLLRSLVVVAVVAADVGAAAALVAAGGALLGSFHGWRRLLAEWVVA